MEFCECATRGCREQEYLVLCSACRALVCPGHARQVDGATRCPKCAPAGTPTGIQQADLFSGRKR